MAKNPLHCSFCGRNRDEVKILIAGQEGHICENCVEHAREIIEQELMTKDDRTPSSFKLTVKKPVEIKKFLDVAYDTTSQPQTVIRLFTKGTIRNFIYNYYIEHREQLKQYKSPDQLLKQFRMGDSEWIQLQNFAFRDSIDLKKTTPAAKDFVLQQMQNLLARQIWRSEGYYEFANANDPMIKKALAVLK